MTEKYSRVQIVCVETGQIYESAAALAKATGATRATVSNHLAGRFPSLRGLHFARTVQPTPKA